MTYTQLTQEQRYQISALLKTAQSQTKVAEVIEEYIAQQYAGKSSGTEANEDIGRNKHKEKQNPGSRKQKPGYKEMFGSWWNKNCA